MDYSVCLALLHHPHKHLEEQNRINLKKPTQLGLHVWERKKKKKKRVKFGPHISTEIFTLDFTSTWDTKDTSVCFKTCSFSLQFFPLCKLSKINNEYLKTKMNCVVGRLYKLEENLAQNKKHHIHKKPLYSSLILCSWDMWLSKIPTASLAPLKPFPFI